MWTGEPFPRHNHPSACFIRARWAQLKHERKRFFFREMGFPSIKIAARATYMPSRAISFLFYRCFAIIERAERKLGFLSLKKVRRDYRLCTKAKERDLSIRDGLAPVYSFSPYGAASSRRKPVHIRFLYKSAAFVQESSAFSWLPPRGSWHGIAVTEGVLFGHDCRNSLVHEV